MGSPQSRQLVQTFSGGVVFFLVMIRLPFQIPSRISAKPAHAQNFSVFADVPDPVNLSRQFSAELAALLILVHVVPFALAGRAGLEPATYGF